MLAADGPKIAKDMLKSVLMVWSRVSGVMAEGGDGVAEIRTSPQHGVHEGA